MQVLLIILPSLVVVYKGIETIPEKNYVKYTIKKKSGQWQGQNNNKHKNHKSQLCDEPHQLISLWPINKFENKKTQTEDKKKPARHLKTTEKDLVDNMGYPR